MERRARSPEFLRLLEMEHAGLGFLLKPPAEAKDRMIQRQGFDKKLFLIEHAAAEPPGEFPERQFEFELKIGRSKRSIQENPETLGAEDIQRGFTAVKMERAEES